MSVPQRFNESEYINWLKCMNALCILKEVLHPFIDTGVNELHENIKRKVICFLGGSNGAIQCNTCSSKYIIRKRATGQNPAKWMIHCPNNVCDVWLDEILAVHNEPKKRSINWKNSDITKWDTDPYEIARVFMPKGLDKKTNLPEELDIPAALSLLKYCTRFSKSVPNTQLLTDLIDVRNRLYHSGTFKVHDADRDKWIDIMSQLVIDLNLQGTVHTDLCLLKTEAISINFQEIETRALLNIVTLLKCDFEAIKTEMACLQETQNQLSMRAEKLEDDTSMKTETLKRDMQEVKRGLIELTQVSDKIVIFLGNNDIKDKNVLAAMEINEKNIIELRCRQCEVEKNILDVKSELSSVKEQVGKHKEETTHLLEQLEITVEENAQEGKNSKREGLTKLRLAFVIWTFIALWLHFVYAVTAVHTYWTKLKPELGDGVKWQIASRIVIAIQGIYCFAASLWKYCINRFKGKIFSCRLLMLAVLCGMTICVYKRGKYELTGDCNGQLEKSYEGVLHSIEPFPDCLLTQYQCCKIRHSMNCMTDWNRTSISTNETMRILSVSCNLENVDQRQSELRIATGVDSFKTNEDKCICLDLLEEYTDIGQQFVYLDIFQIFTYMMVEWVLLD